MGYDDFLHCQGNSFFVYIHRAIDDIAFVVFGPCIGFTFFNRGESKIPAGFIDYIADVLLGLCFGEGVFSKCISGKFKSVIRLDDAIINPYDCN